MVEFLVQGMSVRVDDADAGWVKNLSMSIDIKGYVKTYHRGKCLGLHRLVARASKGVHVHHKNGDKLDNTRQNLVKLGSGQHGGVHNRERHDEFYTWCAANIHGRVSARMAAKMYRRATGKIVFHVSRKTTIENGIPSYFR